MKTLLNHWVHKLPLHLLYRLPLPQHSPPPLQRPSADFHRAVLIILVSFWDNQHSAFSYRSPPPHLFSLSLTLLFVRPFLFFKTAQFSIFLSFFLNPLFPTLIFQFLLSPYLYTFYRAQESIPSLAGRSDNPICRTGPPGYIGWQNRFPGIDSWARINVYKYGLRPLILLSLWAEAPVSSLLSPPPLPPPSPLQRRTKNTKQRLKISPVDL